MVGEKVKKNRVGREYREHRLSITVSEELYQRLNKCFEWGERNRVMTRVLEWLCGKIEEEGLGAVLYFIRDNDIDSLIKLKDKREEEKECKNGNS